MVNHYRLEVKNSSRRMNARIVASTFQLKQYKKRHA